MKKTVLFALLALVFGTCSFAGTTYVCNSKDQGTFIVQIGDTQKSIKVVLKDYNEDSPGVAKLNPKYKPNNPKWVGSKIFDFGSDPFGADGFSSFLLSKEIVAGAAMGFAQYRNTWDSFTSITMPCKKAVAR